MCVFAKMFLVSDKEGSRNKPWGFCKGIIWKDNATYFMAIVQCGKFDYKGD
jgi:hypothetical protein